MGDMASESMRLSSLDGSLRLSWSCSVTALREKAVLLRLGRKEGGQPQAHLEVMMNRPCTL